jgi:glycosyltransferase involved in cell wall biosynthesis
MKPVVSVVTITYNHGPYIRRCIEGVLMQKTSFPFEFIIGEDCSTDGTREIVLDYAKKYPGIIRAITSEVNVGSLENINRANSACQGEFIAFCEGDDFWIDPLKLQKQYDAIIKYEATLVAHGTFVIFYQNGKKDNEAKIRRARDGSGFLDIKEILEGKALFHTSSFFLRSDILKNLPDWYFLSPAGDLPIKVVSANSGKIYYVDEIMSVYRKGTSGSYTDQKLKSIVQKDGWRSNHEKEFIQKYMNIEKDFLQMYVNIDKYTEYRYTEIIRETITGRLLFYFEVFGNLDFLPSIGLQKKVLNLIAIFMHPISSRLQKNILRKIVRRKIVDYLQDLNGAC